MSEAELFDRFVYWLGDDFSKFSHAEIEKLWEEFMNDVVPTLEE